MKVFICQRCGACCQGESTVSLTPQEIENIANFLKISVPDFLQTYTLKKGEKRIEMKVLEGHCIFYQKEEKICLIHPVKPKPCREWPFPPIVFQDETNFLIIKESCPALKNFSFEDVLNLRNLTK